MTRIQRLTRHRNDSRKRWFASVSSGNFNMASRAVCWLNAYSVLLWRERAAAGLVAPGEQL